MNRRTLIPAPSEGPYGVEHLDPAPDPTRIVGGYTILSVEPDWVVPVRPMPEPHPPSHLLIPFMVKHPYGPPFIPESANLGRLRYPSPMASLVPAAQRAYSLRTNSRRPVLVQPGDRLP